MKSSKNKVLITDDDKAVQKTFSIGLEKAGFEVKVAGTGKEALDILRGNYFAPDCIMLDIRMPEMTGLEALPILREEFPLIPVIMLTALTDLEIAVDTMRKGAFDYLTKPVRMIELVETIKKAIRYRWTLLENERLMQENREYQRSLEKKVEERTRELFLAYEKLKTTNLETVKVLAETIEAKDPYTRGHCQRVRLISREIAVNLDIEKEKIELLEYSALLHDIGKIGIPEAILNKDGSLSEEERNIFRMHPVIGERILNNVEFFKPCLPVIRNHHEWFNGSGYPDQLEGEKIHLLARIVAVADAFDAMTSTRPYRMALSKEKAIDELARYRETQFDPQLVDIFIENEIYSILSEY